jgi:hypothetical protein
MRIAQVCVGMRYFCIDRTTLTPLQTLTGVQTPWP